MKKLALFLTIVSSIIVFSGCEKRSPADEISPKISKIVIIEDKRVIVEEIATGKVISDDKTTEKLSEENFKYEDGRLVEHISRRTGLNYDFKHTYKNGKIALITDVDGGTTYTFLYEGDNLDRVIQESGTNHVENKFVYNNKGEISTITTTRDNVTPNLSGLMIYKLIYTVEYTGKNITKVTKRYYDESGKEATDPAIYTYEFSNTVINPYKDIFNPLVIENISEYVSENLFTKATNTNSLGYAEYIGEIISDGKYPTKFLVSRKDVTEAEGLRTTVDLLDTYEYEFLK